MRTLRLIEEETAACPRAGRIWMRVVFLLACMGVLVSALLHVLVQARRTAGCTENLQSIYRALELYEMDRGVLPSLAFYPDNPLEDPDSIRLVLESYGLASARCICPQSRPVQRAAGMTYLWNVALNGQRIPRGAEATWMLVDMEALAEDVPAPHLRRYNVLYSDGTVKRVRAPRRDLPGL